MQANFMEYPEMYYMHWWAGHPVAILRFTPKRASDGRYFTDLDSPFKVLWASNKETREFFEKSKKSLQFQRKAMLSERSRLIVAIFEQKGNIW